MSPWIWIVFGCAGALVALPLLLGWALPRRFEGEIRVRLHDTPERVWAAIRSPRRHPLAGVLVRRVLPLEGEGGAWLEDLGNTRLEVRPEVVVEGQELRLRVEDLRAPVTSLWSLRIEGVPQGTVVHATNHTEIGPWSLRTPLFRIAMVLEDGVHKVLREYFRGIAEDLDDTAEAVHEGQELPPVEAA